MRLWQVFSWLGALVPWALLAGAGLLVFGQLKSPAAVLQLWRPWAEVGILACGMTAVILTGGIDLSVGSIVALASVVLGLLWHDAHWPVLLAAAGAIATGLAAGLGNGLLIRIGIRPLVATLATMAGYAGLAMALASGRRITGFPESLTYLGQGAPGGLPAQLWALAVVMLCDYGIVNHTCYGRYLFAMGDNRTAAELAGVPVGRIEWWLYATNGLLAGVVAVLMTARGGAAVPNAGVGLELQVIAAVVLGGTRITGGAGGPGRTLLGLAILANLEIGLRLLRRVPLRIPGTQVSWELNANGRLVVIGILLIAMAALNERLRRSALDRAAARR